MHFRASRNHYAERSEPNRRFVWNSYLLQAIEGVVAPEWILYLVHGFVSQYNMSVLGRPVYVTLLARRSNRYAGTRFLKRGANFEVSVTIGFPASCVGSFVAKSSRAIGDRSARHVSYLAVLSPLFSGLFYRYRGTCRKRRERSAGILVKGPFIKREPSAVVSINICSF